MSARKCSPQWGDCALLSGHRGPHHGYPENIEAIRAEERAKTLAEVLDVLRRKATISRPDIIASVRALGVKT